MMIDDFFIKRIMKKSSRLYEFVKSLDDFSEMRLSKKSSRFFMESVAQHYLQSNEPFNNNFSSVQSLILSKKRDFSSVPPLERFFFKFSLLIYSGLNQS